MFRRLINNNVKTIGIRRVSNDCNNHRIVEELKKINSTLEFIYFNTIVMNLTLCLISITNLKS